MIKKTLKDYKSNHLFEYDTYGMIKFDDFLKDVEISKLSKNLVISKSYTEYDDYGEDIDIPFFELNEVFIEFNPAWYRQTKETITVKDFLYLYYHTIFGVSVYSYIEATFDKIEKRTTSNFLIINSFRMDDILKNIQPYLTKEELIYKNEPNERNYKIRGDNNYQKRLETYNNWKGKAIKTYQIDTAEYSKTIYIIPIRMRAKNDIALNNLKKILSKFSENNSYDKSENIDETNIIKTGEIFEYLISNCKNKEQISNNTIRSELKKLGITQDILEEDLEKSLDFVNNFLDNIL